ncbi:MAG: hypothetical protein ACRDOU_27790 [Streptosporangiaceae bacterium]
MMRPIRGRLRAAVVVLILGTGNAAAEAVGYGWHNAIPVALVTVVLAVGFFRVGGRDNDIGAIYGSRGDERQRMVRLRAQALTVQMMALAVLIGFMVQTARRAPTWPFVVIAGVAAVSFVIGLAIYREHDTSPDIRPGLERDRPRSRS